MGTLQAVPETQNNEPRGTLSSSMLERMTLILESFESRCDRLTLEDVVRRTDLPRSTVHRILTQLVRLHWLEHNSLGYSVGIRLLGFTDTSGNHSKLGEVAAPLLQKLHTKTTMIVHLAILDGGQIFYSDKVDRLSATFREG